MASCRACGAGIGRQFRFCSQCGVAAGVELDLLDLAPPAHDEAIVSYGRPGRFWAAVGGGTLAVLAGLWALSSVGGGGGAGDTADAGHHRPATTARATTPPTTDAGPTAPSAAEGASTTTAAETDAATSVIAGGGPLLGEPVGLSLLIGGEQRLRRVDLDTGVVTTYERPGVPLFATGGLVLIQGSGGLVRAVPLADPDAETPSLWSQFSPALPRPGMNPGEVWLPDASGETLVWRLVDAGSRDVLSEVDSGTAAWWSQPESILDPEVVGSTTGEVFERVDESYERVADGELIAVGRTRVLVRRCENPGSCTLHWLDRASWRETADPVPEVAARQVTGASISDDGRLLVYATASESHLFDVSRGQGVAEVASWPGSLSVSPDGRWAALVHIAGRIALYDVERGEVTEAPVSLASDSQVIIVPSA